MQHWHHADRHVDLSSTIPMDGAAWASTCCDRYLPAAPPWRDSGDIRLSPTLARLEVHCFPGATWSPNLARRPDERAPA
jgi:hypothetical protein